MSSFDVSRKRDFIVLTRCEGPFALPVSHWELTVQEAERIAKILTDAAKSMKLRTHQTTGEPPNA